MNDSFFQAPKKETNYESDLACERRKVDLTTPGITYRTEENGIFKWERIEISSREGELEIGRPCGSYDTLSIPRMDTLEDYELEDAANEVAKELCAILEKTAISPARILVVGLGNSELTPDSIGPKTAESVNATMHLRKSDPDIFRTLDCMEMAVNIPGVMANTGIEATDSISAICDIIEPDVVIAIDSIASKSPSRLGTTIQISNTGIFPGSGIGNKRRPLNERTLGIPVIAVGVPTVINARAFLGAEESDNVSFKDLFVSPRDIDSIVTSSAKIISLGINQAFGIF